MILSERLKVVNGLPPKADAFAAAANLTDIVCLKNYKYATFIILTGVSVNNDSVLSVVAGQTVDGTVTTTVPFKYRKCVSGDTLGTLTDVAAGATVALTASTANQMLIIEVDAAAVEEAHPGYDCVGLKVADGSNVASQLGAIAIVLSNARYADEASPSAIID